jgi:hypothetical protein
MKIIIFIIQLIIIFILILLITIKITIFITQITIFRYLWSKNFEFWWKTQENWVWKQNLIDMNLDAGFINFGSLYMINHY